MELYDYQYASSTWRGTPKFSCFDCPYYIFNQEATMLAHCRKTGHGRSMGGDLTIDSYVKEFASQMSGVIITLGYLCWNTKIPSVEGVGALLEEAERLEALGCLAHIFVVDNGSSDGTYEAIQAKYCSHPRLTVYRSPVNLGISAGRNLIIDFALVYDSKYVMFMDGDIEVVPLSAYVMARYLECHKDVGVIGAYSANWTKEREKAAKHLFEIPESRVVSNVKCAWTQYGLFRCSMFDQGLSFDTTGPFGEPGWGFEDDDFYFQMQERGWKNCYFGGMKYLHRNLRSSWPNLEKEGVQIPVMYKRRKDFLVKKWRQRGLNPGTLKLLEGQQIPV